MNQNVASWDRILRAFMASGVLAGALLTRFPVAVRVLVFGVTGAYLLMTALSGRCLGYGVMGRSTCPFRPKGPAT
jgi:Protein of unknown function (DUF2892)